MSKQHRVFIDEEPGKYRAFCNCRASSRLYPNMWEAEDWKLSHMEMVDRVHTHLNHGRVPSLSSSRDYYREMADRDPVPENRTLWEMLAVELDRRLNDTSPADQEGLW